MPSRIAEGQSETQSGGQSRPSFGPVTTIGANIAAVFRANRSTSSIARIGRVGATDVPEIVTLLAHVRD